MTKETAEELRVLDVFRRAKKERHATVVICIKDGVPVKVDWTHKEDLRGLAIFKE